MNRKTRRNGTVRRENNFLPFSFAGKSRVSNARALLLHLAPTPTFSFRRRQRHRRLFPFSRENEGKFEGKWRPPFSCVLDLLLIYKRKWHGGSVYGESGCGGGREKKFLILDCGVSNSLSNLLTNQLSQLKKSII
ncbi:hypothetical protein Nepgr_024979 [Nepenthes gracilis]|uniref:Uncharacterized protein n=1 Tax=Nepenthes gracilis TaxID=150966 RepID=A0AAD3T6X1_NEPGR|nr:hypothetical protein Nepgr_024979 [Nepenthes gracilis]